MKLVRPIKADPLKGVNQPRLGIDEEGRKVVFKTNAEQGRSEAEAERLDDVEVIMSHLFVDELKLEGVVAKEALNAETGQKVLFSPYLEQQSTLKVAGTRAVSNPDNAVAQVIAREFLGDSDAHAKNFLVGPKGTLTSIDFGKAGQFYPVEWRRSSFHDIMNNLSNKDNISTFVTRIENLSDEDIENMVDRSADHLSEPNPKLENNLVQVLIQNRNFLAKVEPYSAYLN